MFIIILLNVLKKFNYTVDTDNLTNFIKALKFELNKIQTLENEEESKRLDDFFELIKKNKQLKKEQDYQDFENGL